MIKPEDGIKLDPVDIRKRLYKMWLKTDGLSYADILNEIPISAFALRNFLDDKNQTYRRTTLMKMLRWIEKKERIHGM